MGDSRSDVEQSIAGSRTETSGRESLFVQPSLQRIRAEILLDDQDRPTRWVQANEPTQEHAMELGLADLDGWVAPDQVESERLIDFVGSTSVEIRHIETTRVVVRQLTGSFVHVDGDHTRLWSAA